MSKYKKSSASPEALLPTVRVSPKGAKLLRRGSPWVYRTELLTTELLTHDAPAAPTELPAGAVVRVVDVQGNPIGQAFHARTSPLALRLLTRKGASEEPVDAAFLERRLAPRSRAAPCWARETGCAWCTARRTSCPASSWTATARASRCRR
jgi:23S rRNA (cytosine1962-C5)-methyltransferase